MECCECGQEFESVKGAAFEITGFEIARAQGGTNHVHWRKQTGKMMCAKCVFDKVHGVSRDQMTLA